MEPEDIPRVQRDLTILTDLYYVDYFPEQFETYTKLEELFSNCNLTTMEVLALISPTCSDILSYCRWKGREYRCDALFQETYTPEGICCSFNHFAFRNLTFKG